MTGRLHCSLVSRDLSSMRIIAIESASEERKHFGARFQGEIPEIPAPGRKGGEIPARDSRRFLRTLLLLGSRAPHETKLTKMVRIGDTSASGLMCLRSYGACALPFWTTLDLVSPGAGMPSPPMGLRSMSAGYYAYTPDSEHLP